MLSSSDISAEHFVGLARGLDIRWFLVVRCIPFFFVKTGLIKVINKLHITLRLKSKDLTTGVERFYDWSRKVEMRLFTIKGMVSRWQKQAQYVWQIGVL